MTRPLRKISFRLLVYAAVIGLAAAGLSACGKSGVKTASSAATAPASINWAIMFPVKTLDPGLVYDGGGNNFVAYQEADSLLRFGEDLKLEPGVASSWKQTSPTTYVYNLRSDVKFWDGHPVTPVDVAYSINRVQSKQLASPLASLASSGSIKKVVVTGPHQVTMYLTKANPIAHWLPATPVGQIVEKAFVEKMGSTFGTSVATTMCSGPYRPVTWNKGSAIIMRAVPNYWDKSLQPSIKQVTFSEISESTAIVAGLRSGDIDGTLDLSARDAATLQSDPNLSVAVAEGGSPNYISPNLLKGPFKNPLIRHAYTLAINRTGLASAINGSAAQPLKGPVPPGLTTYQKAYLTSSYNALPLPVTPDIAAAKKLIQQANAAGTKVTIAALSGGSIATVAAELQQAGAAIGLNITVRKLPSSDFFAESFSGKEPRTYDALLNFWMPDFPDYSALLVPPFGSVYSNVEGYFSPAYKALENKWAATENESLAQAQALAAMQQMLIVQTVKIPLYTNPLVQVHKTTFGGYTNTMMNIYQPFMLYMHGQ